MGHPLGVATVSTPRPRRKALPPSRCLSNAARAFIRAFPALFDANPETAPLEAARIAGFAGDETALKRRAYRLLQNPRVQRALDRRMVGRLLGPNEVLLQLSDLGATPWSDLDSVAKGVKLKALHDLGSHYGLWVDPATRQLQEQLRALLAAHDREARRIVADVAAPQHGGVTQRVIDTTAREVAALPAADERAGESDEPDS